MRDTQQQERFYQRQQQQQKNVDSNPTQAQQQQPVSSPGQLRHEEQQHPWGQKGEFIAPILVAAQRLGSPRPSDILYWQAMQMRSNPAAVLMAGFQQSLVAKAIGAKPEPGAGLMVAGGIVESAESTLELAFPYPVPTPARPLTGARLAGIAIGSYYQGKAFGYVFEEPLQVLGEKIGAKLAKFDKDITGGRVTRFAQKVSERFGSPKAVRIAGAEELEATVAEEGNMTSARMTKLHFEEEPIKSMGGLAAKEFSRYVTPDELMVSGTERVLAAGGDDVALISRAYESVRPASTFVEAAKGAKEAFYKEIATSTGVGEIFQTTGKKGFVEAITALESENLTAEGGSIAQRALTGFQMTGKIDPQVYLNLVRAVGPEVAQTWYPQMGGVTLQQIERLGTKEGISVLMRAVDIKTSLTFPSSLPGMMIAGAVKGLNIIPSSKKRPDIVPSTVFIEKVKTQPYVIPVSDIPTTPKNPPQQPSIISQSLTGFSIPGFKFEGGGFDLAPITKRQRSRGRKRMYPILTGEEVLSLQLNTKHRRRR